MLRPCLQSNMIKFHEMELNLHEFVCHRANTELF